MKKKLVLSLVISIITLVYLILDYMGYVRFYSLGLFSTDSYLEKYKKIEKYGKDRVVISFQNENNNLDKRFINSLLDQTVRVDEIALTVNYKDMNTIPENLKKVLSIHGYSKQYGNDINCPIYSILRELETNTKIIFVNNGKVYNKDFIQTMLDESEKNKDCVICMKEKSKVIGVLVKPSFFKDVNKSTLDCNLIEWLKTSTGNKIVEI